MDAATLYANIMDDSDETTLMGLLLRQGENNRSVSKTICYSEIDKYDYEEVMWSSGILLLISLTIIGCIKSKKVREFFTHLLSIALILFILMITTWDYFAYEINLSELGTLIINIIITLIIYILFFYKKREYLFKFTIQYGILGVLFIIAVFFTDRFGDYDKETLYAIIMILIIPIIFTIVQLLKRNGKKVDKIENILKKLLKAEIILVISVLLFKEKFLIVALILDYIYENIIKYKGKNDKKIEEKIEANKKNILETALIIIIILLIVIGIYNSIKYPKRYGISSEVGPVNDDIAYNSKDNIINSFDSNSSSWIQSGTDLESANNKKDISSSINNIFENSISFDSDSIESSSIKEENFVEEKEISEDDNIRNVFLESLCFIPELVTENGKANKDIKLSDNITTWQIQVVGNTKDGKVGYSSNSFRVFKEFFVDFSMPTNTVVGDKISIPVTVYNYTENPLNIELNVKEENWFKFSNYEKNIDVKAKETKLVYLPIEIVSSGENKLRIEAKTDTLTDIVEKSMTTKENGIKISNVVASGTFEDKMDLDVLYLQNYKEGTGKLRVKLYSTAMSQAVEGLENIFKMPTGCFEQVSSSLYPDILVLKYLEDKQIDNELKQKALQYIETGYQKLLTYEVSKEKGGYSLYGHSPAEVVLTSYGLMEMTDLSKVYDVEEKVIENMKEYVFSKQKANGSFDIKNGYTHGIVDKTDELTLNAYVTWTLSECFPEDERLEKSIEYLESKLDKVTDNYTLALIANVFANTKNKKTNNVINKLVKDINISSEGYSYMNSNVRDYYGTYGNYQNLQTTALTSLALTKANSNSKTNLELIKYIISRKDVYGTWGTTQGTILSLKALIEYEGKTTVGEQNIKVELNGEEKTIKVEKNNLDIYEEIFNNIEKENKLTMSLEKGKMYYEIIQEYYIDYSEYDMSENKLQVEYTINIESKVNDTLKQNIKISNTSGQYMENCMLEINIPQGCSVKEEALSKLETKGEIEKYEYSYGKIYLYIREFDENKFIDLNIEYKADYPAQITGGSIRVYDYYNPDIQAIAMPITINIK
ncbi:MAG: alpha-2-macroglobulin family protein [Candidatus Scatovivens sp.]